MDSSEEVKQTASEPSKAATATATEGTSLGAPKAVEASTTTDNKPANDGGSSPLDASLNVKESLADASAASAEGSAKTVKRETPSPPAAPSTSASNNEERRVADTAERPAADPPAKKQKVSPPVVAVPLAVSAANNGIAPPTTTKPTTTAAVVAAPPAGTLPTASSSSATSSSSSSVNNKQLVVDYPSIQHTVRDLLALLQSYGPLTAGQLEYNLPPMIGAHLNKSSLHDILQVLVAIGLVETVEPESVSNANTNKPGAAPVAPTGTSATNNVTSTPPTRYCVCQGVPRADVVMPSTLMQDIEAAHKETERSWERRNRLAELLEQSTSSDSNPRQKENLKQLLQKFVSEYPEILRDPVYVTALRNMHVDCGDRARSVVKAKKRKPEDNKSKIRLDPSVVKGKPDKPTVTEILKVQQSTSAVSSNVPPSASSTNQGSSSGSAGTARAGAGEGRPSTSD